MSYKNRASSQLQTRLFVAFEGGGAKGLVHIGALAALEKRNYRFSGISGTSAGAIIAALKAAGYSANEMLNTESGLSCLDNLDDWYGKKIKVTDLFGKYGWVKIKILLALYSALTNQHLRSWIQLAFLVNTVFIFVSYFFNYYTEIWYILMFTVTIISSIILGVIYFAVKAFEGLNELNVFKYYFNELLRAKLFPGQLKRTVFLGDFGKNGNPPLKVIAANIDGKIMRLFSSEDPFDNNIAAADVVAASICLPFIFKPHQVNGVNYLDGGIVSNLPVWPFDEERALDPDAKTIAFEIRPRSLNNSVAVKDSWLTSAIQTALFGASALNKRAVGEPVTVHLPTELDTLDFDASYARIRQTVLDAEESADLQISRTLIDIPNLYREACDLARASVSETMFAFVKRTTGVVIDGRTRIAVAVREPDALHSLRIKHCVGFENDTDEGILVPLDGSVVGEAWTTGRALIRRVPLPSANNLSSHSSRQLRRLVSKDITWFFAVPIFVANRNINHNSKPIFVVAVDGSAVLDEAVDVDALMLLLEPKVTTLFEGIASALLES